MGCYYPYFRGKQNELITIRDNAELLKNADFIPIIEPVKQSTNGLERAIQEMHNKGGTCIIVANPNCGDYCENHTSIEQLINRLTVNSDALAVGVLLDSDIKINNIEELCSKYISKNVTLIHHGFQNGKGLANLIAEYSNINRHIFVDEHCGKLYRKHFNDSKIRILIRDGFQKRINKNHPDCEPFSDLHATYEEENMDGFGDFLVVGDDYSETGGPAYAIAIHLTYIDPDRDDAMFIHHFKSDKIDTPTDPAGKFLEALNKLVAEVTRQKSPILMSNAVNEFLDLHAQSHFPGLGYIKKLSMQHHIETLADYFNSK